MQVFTKVGLEALLTPDNCVVVMIDHQPFQLANVNSHEPTMVINNAIGLAMTAKAYGIPTILTTVTEERGGRIFKGIQDIFPDHKTINRTYINAWEDQRVVEAVKQTGRRKIVFAALWTEMCLAMPAIHAMGDGYDVYVVTDASGGVSVESHDMAIRRLVAAGAQRSLGWGWPENRSVIGRAPRGSGRSPKVFPSTEALAVLYSHGRRSCFVPVKPRARRASFADPQALCAIFVTRDQNAPQAGR
jgi:nicotinamidase-related amidase